MSRFGCIWFVVWNAAIAAVLGGAVAVLPLGWNLLAFAVWIGLLVRSAWKGERSAAFPRVLIQVAVFTLVIVAAIIAPTKTTEQFLDRTIELPKNVMTLGEIEGDPNGLPPDWSPRSLHVQVPEDERSNEVVFSSTSVTLREVVHAVETQSTLRHRFGHCGNGSTILWGGDCSFGLHLRRSRK